MNFGAFKIALTRGATKAGLVLKKHSPTILTVTGVVGMVGAGVLACRSTLKANEVVERHRDRLSKIHEAKELWDNGDTVVEGTEYSDEDYRKDIVVAYSKTVLDFAKLYGPAILTAAVSIASILSGHNILRKRNLALSAAYAAVDKAFKEYRDRVRKELGEDEDYHFRTGAERVKMTEVTTDENGNTKKEKVDVFDVKTEGDGTPSMYARFFDEYSPYWQKDPVYNKAFLKARQNEANDRLHINGVLFLNTVYEMLGLPPTKEGAVVGWLLGKEQKDGFVDFGIFNNRSPEVRRFVNGDERSVLLDFNVDGVIFDKL